MDIKYNNQNVLGNSKELIFVQLNEINFNLVKVYLKKYKTKFKNLKKISRDIIFTHSENEFQLLEPWIQWYSIHSGLNAKDHKIFRLGDGANSEIELIYEKIEKLGYTIGAISPMNAKNNCLNPIYFIPDPWTKTKSDGSFLSKILTNLLTQTVNNNANNKLTIKNYLSIIHIIFRYGQIKHYYFYIKLFLKSFKSKWSKAIFLDLMLHDIHIKKLNNQKPNFSSIFLNAGAHIQHHYYFNSLADTNMTNPQNYIDKGKDPFYEILEIYDLIIGDYLKKKNIHLILATGLSQKPTDDIEYYYRLKDHKKFLKEKLSLTFQDVKPRMSRDFLILFDNNNDRDNTLKKLQILKINKIKLFDEIEIRDKELFVTLTYNKEINKKDYFLDGYKKIDISTQVSFVAIKNAKHDSKGFLYRSENLKGFFNNINIKDIHNLILQFFNTAK